MYKHYFNFFFLITTLLGVFLKIIFEFQYYIGIIKFLVDNKIDILNCVL